MKTTVVPAQVTTVEDRIVGNLSFSQMIFLIIPVFASAAIFAVLPPLMGAAVYKYVIIGLFVITCSTLAIRIKGQILAVWFVTILRYNVRPKYYLFNKNVATLREDYPIRINKGEQRDAPAKSKQRVIQPKLDIPATARVLAALENPAANVRFETTKKGALYVRFTEVEE
jgi:hypothetical protein